jgi:hypothetical protein
MLIHYAYNPTLVNKPPQIPVINIHLQMWRNINASFRNVRGTPESLIRRILEGHPYTATHNGFRHSNRFLVGQVLSLDFDDGSRTLDELAEDPFIKENAYFLYTTPSHTDESPRSRVVFILQHPVRIPQVFSRMAEALVLKYNTSDQSCKDPARIFFGSKDARVIRLRNWLNISGLKKEFEILSARDRKLSREVVVKDISSETIRQNVERKLSEIINAPDGERHGTRLNVSTVFGGWVAAGYISQEHARQLLIDASMRNTNSNQHLIEHDIQSGLEFGMRRPLSMQKKTLTDWGFF